MTKPTTTKTTTTKAPAMFEAPEGFADMAPKAQVKCVAAWVAANPTAKIAPIAIAEGGLPTYLRNDTGKRADINRVMVAGVTMAKYLPISRKLGGGYTDIVAGLLGGYSRSAAGYGNPHFTLQA